MRERKRDYWAQDGRCYGYFFHLFKYSIILIWGVGGTEFSSSLCLCMSNPLCVGEREKDRRAFWESERGGPAKFRPASGVIFPFRGNRRVRGWFFLRRDLRDRVGRVRNKRDGLSRRPTRSNLVGLCPCMSEWNEGLSFGYFFFFSTY